MQPTYLKVEITGQHWITEPSILSTVHFLALSWESDSIVYNVLWDILQLAIFLPLPPKSWDFRLCRHDQMLSQLQILLFHPCLRDFHWVTHHLSVMIFSILGCLLTNFLPAPLPLLKTGILRRPFKPFMVVIGCREDLSQQLHVLPTHVQTISASQDPVTPYSTQIWHLDVGTHSSWENYYKMFLRIQLPWNLYFLKVLEKSFCILDLTLSIVLQSLPIIC